MKYAAAILVFMAYLTRLHGTERSPVCSQVFSADNGKTWEWNMSNVSEELD